VPIYISLGIIVNIIWASAILIPYIMIDTDPLLIALGRYFAYGGVSLVLMLLNYKNWPGLNAKQWRTAFYMGFYGNLGYYLLVTSSIHFAGITLAALIIGGLPVSLIIAGNFVEKSFSHRKLLTPVTLILLGMLLLTLGHDNNAVVGSNPLLGAMLAFAGLAMWTYYAIANTLFLKKNSNISAHNWSLAIGVACLVEAAIVTPMLSLVTDMNFAEQLSNQSALLRLVCGSLFLGVIVSWLATLVWNIVTRNLPVAVAGQLIVFETIASLFYGYITDMRLPDGYETAAITLVLFGVCIGLRLAYGGANKAVTNVTGDTLPHLSPSE
jgi:drug/metabolite transporter (DMT)-like permease